MLTTEFNLEDAREIWEEEAREEGLKQGLKQGREKIAIEMKKEGFSDDTIAKITKLPIAKIRKIKS